MLGCAWFQPSSGAGRILCVLIFISPGSSVVPGEFNRFHGQCWANSARFIFYFTRYSANSGGSTVINLESTLHHDGGQA